MSTHYRRKCPVLHDLAVDIFELPTDGNYVPTRYRPRKSVCVREKKKTMIKRIGYKFSTKKELRSSNPVPKAYKRWGFTHTCTLSERDKQDLAEFEMEGRRGKRRGGEGRGEEGREVFEGYLATPTLLRTLPHGPADSYIRTY